MKTLLPLLAIAVLAGCSNSDTGTAAPTEAAKPLPSTATGAPTGGPQNAGADARGR